MNTKTSTNSDEASLMELKAQMTEQQRSDMAEIIGNELKRREALKTQQVHMKSNVKASSLSGGIGANDLRDIYESADKNIQQLRVKALETRVREAKKEASRLGVSLPRGGRTLLPSVIPTPSLPKYTINTNKLSVILFGIGIIAFAGMKSLRSPQTAVAETQQKNISAQADSRASLGGDTAKVAIVTPIDNKPNPVPATPEKKTEIVDLSVKIPTTEAEKSVLMQLDQRRVELERRRLVLDEKEKELLAQSRLVAEKITELKSLTNKLAALRTEKDNKYSARLDQLASVYGAMAPNEASGLIAKLDEEVALGLLERMPEKRMAQILGVMEQSRAIELTKLLTDRKGL